MKKLDTVCWGIIGVGDVCERKSAPAMQKIPNSKLVAVMRRTASKAEDYARRHGVPKWYTDADQLIQDPEVNAIYIATPPDTHAEYTIRAAKAGKPVYVEKPMARTYDECRQMIEACESAGVPLYVAYYRRSLPHFLKIKELLDQGKIGQVRLADIRLYQSRHLVPNLDGKWRVDPEIAGGGYFFDLGSHQLDYLDFLFGPICEVHGFKANQGGLYPAADIVSGSFLFESGVVANGLWCFSVADAARKEEVTIVGDRGQIRFATFGKPELRLLLDGHEEQVLTLPPPENIQYFLIEQIVEALRGERDQVVSTGATAARTNWVMGELGNLVAG